MFNDPTETPMASAISETILICSFGCSEQNVKRCRKCNRPFCIMHCNHFSPNFCKECFANLSIVEDKFKRTFDHISENGQLYTKTEERIKRYLDGPDWPFISPWIDSLSDDELKIIWVFHHHIMKAIELENDTRNIEKSRKLRETPVARLITGTVTKTRTVTKIQQPETPEQLKTKWEKAGIAKNVIDMMLAAMKT
jgi:hypothetical protein